MKNLVLLNLLAILAMWQVGLRAEFLIDVTKSPTVESALSLLDKGPERAAEDIWSALGEAYEPGRMSGGGATRKEAFRSWVGLGEWFDLLAQTDQQEFARFLEPYLAYGDKDGERVLFWRPADSPFSIDVEPLSEEERLSIASDPKARELYLGRYVPADFRWQDSTLLEYLGPELATKLTENPARLQEILQTLSHGDFTPAVFQNLRRLHTHDAENFFQYFNLALALAVVFDQKPPPDWPHHQVHQDSLLKDDQTLEERFDFWVDSHANRKLYIDITRLGADQLKFVVDALVPREELRFAQERLRFARSSFHQAYSSIKYDQNRIKTEQFEWPTSQPYTLAEIQKAGGICVDQAYFAMIAGKARGIPTLYFVGQGAEGGHAWFGFLRSDTQWNMDAGRYENQNFAVGAALDPQTWERITDHELKFLGQRVRRTPAFQAGLADFSMARRFLRANDLERALAATSSALASSPQNPEAWEFKLELLERNEVPFSQIRQHLEDAIKQFNNEPDIRTHYQTLLIAAAKNAGDDKLASELERRMIAQNANRRSDLSVSAASGRMTALLQEGKIDEALRDFRSQVNRLGRTGGGNFFYEVVAPIVSYLISEGNPREAKRVLDQARRSLRPDRGSILDQELGRLEEQVDPRQR